MANAEAVGMEGRLHIRMAHGRREALGSIRMAVGTVRHPELGGYVL